MPRRSHVTSNIDTHEIAWGSSVENSWSTISSCSKSSSSSKSEELRHVGNVPHELQQSVIHSTLWLINTKHCCLCTLDERFSIVPRWKPPFVTELKRTDPCHLNGLAMLDGRPKYVTCFADTNTPEGWREHKRDGGCLIDVESNEIIARGFSMPHSPRVHNDRVWLLDSGRGALVTVDPETGCTEIVTQLPGYPRGMTLVGRYAFIGLSQARESKTFGDIAVVEQLQNRKCGVWCVDTLSGHIVGYLEFEQTVAEVFDVQLLFGFQNPAIIGFAKDTIERACVMPPL